jgi:hypothetical protein
MLTKLNRKKNLIALLFLNIDRVDFVGASLGQTRVDNGREVEQRAHVGRVEELEGVGERALLHVVLHAQLVVRQAVHVGQPVVLEDGGGGDALTRVQDEHALDEVLGVVGDEAPVAVVVAYAVVVDLREELLRTRLTARALERHFSMLIPKES